MSIFLMLLCCLCSAAAAAVLALCIFRETLPSASVTRFVSYAKFLRKALSAPVMYWKKSRDEKTLRVALPELAALVAGAQRSGLDFPRALEFSAQHVPPQLAVILQQTLAQITSGSTQQQSLENLANTSPVPELTQLARVWSLGLQSGANMAQFGEHWAEVSRERQRAHAKISALTAQGRYQGIVMACMPIALAVILSIFDSSSFRLFVTTSLGGVLATAALLLWCAGIWWMRKISRVEV